MPWLDEALLDDADLLARLDSRGALVGLATAGAQVREALTRAADAGVMSISPVERPRAVIVGALGASAVVADALEALAETAAPVPVVARKAAPLPGWVGALDLVVAVSVSGRAPGPLALAAEAARRGAALVTVGADDSPLAEITRRARGLHVGLGRDRFSSRTSLWAMLTPVLAAAHQMGLVDVSDDELGRVAHQLDQQAESCRPLSDACVNPAKLLALQLGETVPLVLGESSLTGVVARRAATMLNRVGRVPALAAELPNDGSQLVSAFDGPFTVGGGRGVLRHPDGDRAPRWGGSDIFADPFLDGPAPPVLSLLLVRDPDVDPLVGDAVSQTARDAGVKVIDVSAPEGTPLERFAGQVALMDFAATYLSLGLGLDPLVSRHLAELRTRLR